MAVDLSNPLPISDQSPWLGTLQGNILKFHGRPQAAHIFFAFRDPSAWDAAKATLRRLHDERFVTSALEQERQRERFQAARAKVRNEGGDESAIAGERFGSLLLTASGYEALGFGRAEVAARFAELPEPGTTTSFVAGMRDASAQRDLADPPVDTWEPAFQGRIDGMLLLAHSDPATLATDVAAARAILEASCDIRTIEAGRVIRNAMGQGIEHFGFADGRSQPLYLQSDFKDPAATIEIDGSPHGGTTVRWQPFEPLGRVLIRDPYGENDDCHGSFFVLRKLEQDVRGFRTALVHLARHLSPRDDVARAGALVVGRFEDGTPLALSPCPSGSKSPANDFVYRDDIPGRRCPLQAHIRKVNPRGESPTDPRREPEHRITRRSLTYGDRVDPTAPPETLPSTGRGVLFMCYQASIRRQFAFMQSQWANAPSFPRGEVGTDALVGQGTRAPYPYTWPTAHGDDPNLSTLFAQFVHLKGGEFFFAPSVPFLANLK